MMLEISISEQQEVWKPGERISGVVKISNSKPVYAQQITISLKGIARCRFGLPELASLYSADCILFERKRECLHEPTSFGEAVSSWPFDFNLPEISDEHYSPFREPTRLYTNESVQALPPSFTVPKKETASSNDTCSIVYGIYVSVDNGKLRSNFTRTEGLEGFKAFDFVPDRQDVSPDWRMTTQTSRFECRTPLLNANGNSKKTLSLKDKVMTTLKPSSSPSVTFTIMMSIPKAVVIGQPIPLFIGLQHNNTSISSGVPPVVKLTSCDVRLESLTGLRGHIENYHGSKYQPASHSSWTKNRELSSFTGALPLEDITDLRLHLDLRIPRHSVQSFKTFNVARAYTLKIQATLECAKEKFKANFDVSPLELLASHPLDIEKPPGIGARPSLVPRPSDTSDLPTWEESVGQNGMVVLEEKEELPPEYK